MTSLTKINPNLSSWEQPGRYTAHSDERLSHEEQIAIFNALLEKNYPSIEEEWAFRNGFVTRKNYGKEYIQVLRKGCVVIFNYRCQGNQEGKYTIDYDDDLGDEEEAIINFNMREYDYKTIEEKWAYMRGFIERRKFGTRYLDMQSFKYDRLITYDDNKEN